MRGGAPWLWLSYRKQLEQGAIGFDLGRLARGCEAVHQLHGLIANMPSPKSRLLSRDSNVKKPSIGWFFGHARSYVLTTAHFPAGSIFKARIK
jgi:hypothetical protein